MFYSQGMSFSFPKIYPILDSAVIPQVGRAEFLRRLGSELADAGVTAIVQPGGSVKDENTATRPAPKRSCWPMQRSFAPHSPSAR